MDEKERNPLQKSHVKDIGSTVGVQSYMGQGYERGCVRCALVQLPGPANSMLWRCFPGCAPCASYVCKWPPSVGRPLCSLWVRPSVLGGG